MRQVLFLAGVVLLLISALLVTRSELVYGPTVDGFVSYYLQNAGKAKE